MLNFRSVGLLRRNAAVNAPAQLMWLPVSTLRHHINRYADTDGKASRSLYPYFFSPKDEKRICNRFVPGRSGVVEWKMPGECAPKHSEAKRLVPDSQLVLNDFPWEKLTKSPKSTVFQV
jgi:hypothetical protein